VEAEVVECRACPRLVEWREQAAAGPPRRFAGEEYWARPVVGWGDPAARIALVGLAPAAHGANRTGRMFTGDRAGDFLHVALHRAGLASQPESRHREDGLQLRDAFITAVVRCCPPANRPSPAERDQCLPFLARELGALLDLRVIVALGAFAWDGALRALAALGHPASRARPSPRFGHGIDAAVGPYMLLGCYHPSQQNTFTGRLTAPMLDGVLRRAQELAGMPQPVAPAPRGRSGPPDTGPTEPHRRFRAGRVIQVSVSHGGVPKRPVPQANIGHLGLDGDGHHDRGEHGGPHRAVCLYSVEAIARLRAEGHPVEPGTLGENLTLEGIELGDLRPGDRLRLGERVQLEVAGPCNPCGTIRAAFTDGRTARISALAHPGDSRLYAQVLVPGEVRPGDTVTALAPLPGSLAPVHHLLDRLDDAERAYALATWRAAMASGIDLRLLEIGDLAAAATPAVPDANFNMAVGLRGLPHLVPEILDHFRTSGVTGWLDTADPPWDGATPAQIGSVVAAEPGRIGEPPRVAGLRIRPVEASDTAAVMEWEAVVVAGFEMDAVVSGAWMRLAPALARDRRLHLLLAEIDGEPAGSAGLFVHRGVGNLGPASVLPVKRGLGIHAALIVARARLAERFGCTVLTSQAALGGPSEKNQLRMGFERLWRRGVYRFEPGDRANLTTG
jgi:uracil-DNA glycosylase family 4